MRLSVPQIRKVVEKFYAIEEQEMRGPRRTRKLARVRQIAMYLAGELTPASLPRIGLYYHRDHTTVRYACGVIARRMAKDAMLLEEISFMCAVLNGTPQSELDPPRRGQALANSAVMCTAPAKLTPYCGYVPGGLADSKSVSAAQFDVVGRADPEIPDFLRRSKRAY